MAKKVSDPQLKERVLDWCNDIRLRFGDQVMLKALPAGIQNRSCECPVARACKALVGVITLTRDEKTIEMPSYISDFVCDFDDGYFPELIETKSNA